MRSRRGPDLSTPHFTKYQLLPALNLQEKRGFDHPAILAQVDEYGTIPANSLKQIKAGGDGVGLRTYDP